jgi:hypothetical protein
MITIDVEAQNRVRSPLNPDNMGLRYKTESGYYTFTSPSLWTIEKNLFHLLRNSTRVTFTPRWYMKPDYLSYDEYKTPILDYLLMYVNNVFTMEDFDLDTVIVPSFSSIISICKDKFSMKSFGELETVTW